MTFSLSFDGQSISSIAQIMDMDILLSPEVQEAMKSGGDVLAAEAEAITWQVFDHPTGKLASSIHAVVTSPYEIQIGTDLPYAWRREKGFVGMTDRLGRVGTDKARPYTAPALDHKQQEVLREMELAVEQRLQRLAGS